MASRSFDQALQSSNDDPQGSVLSFLTVTFAYVQQSDPDNENYLNESLDQLDLLLTHVTKDDTGLLTVEIDKMLAKTYSYIFEAMLESANSKFSVKLLDVTDKMASTLTSTKKLSMRNNWYSPQKHLATIILEFLFDRFNGFLNSYKTGLITSLCKHVAKCNDNYNTAVENGTFKASYLTDIIKLVDVITVSDNNSSLITDKLFSRLIKLTKSTLQKDSDGTFIYPLPAIIHAYNILTTLIKSDRYLSNLSSNKRDTDSNYYLNSLKYMAQFIQDMDTDHKQLRLLLAKSIADILVFNYVVFGSNRGQTDKVLENSIRFLFSHYKMHSGFIRLGLLEAFVQFVSRLNLYHETGSVPSAKNFVALKFFTILQCIYSQVLDDRQLERPAGLLVLDDMKSVYSFLIRELDSDINELIILAKLVLGSDQLRPLTGDGGWYDLSLLDFCDLLIDSVGEYILSRQDGISNSHDDIGTQVANKLFPLCTHRDEQIRTKAAATLVRVLKLEPKLINNLLHGALDSLAAAYDTTNYDYSKCHGYAFLISSVFTHCSKEYISTDDVLRAFTLCTSFLKRFNSTLVSSNLLGNAGAISVSNHQRQLLSWILLTGLFNYADESSSTNLFWLDSTQLLGIWKNLLAHSIPSSFLQISGEQLINKADIVKLLEIKSLALVGLARYINYLANSKSHLTPELGSQINQILVKSFIFVRNLPETEFQQEITTNKLRIYQALIKLIPYIDLRTEINSSLLLDVVDNFSSFKKFVYGSIVNEYGIYRTYDDIAFGVTSKILGFELDELTKNDNHIEQPLLKGQLLPVTVFDNTFECQMPFVHTLSNDYMSLLNHSTYSDHYEYPVNQSTMLIDISIELFALVFGDLSLKVQQSVIENLRTAVAHKVVGQRSKGILINASVAVHGLLSYLIRNSIPLKPTILDLIISVLRASSYTDVYVSRLNSSSIGMACSLADSEVVNNQIGTTINSIVETDDPLLRAFDLQVLGCISEHSPVPASVTDTLLTLCMDPHPVVHAASLYSIDTYISSRSPTDINTSFLHRVLASLQEIWISDVFGVHSTTIISCNMSYREHLSSSVLISTILRAIVNVSGPVIVSWPAKFKQILSNLVYGLMFLATDHFTVITRELLQICQGLSLFDKSLVTHGGYERFIRFVITNNFWVGVYGHGLSCMPVDDASTYELYPYTTSDTVWKLSIECYHQLVKFQNGVSDRMERLLWSCLEHDPANKCVKSILMQLLEDSSQAWLEKLIRYFGMARSEILQDLLSVSKKRIDNGGMFFRTALMAPPTTTTTAESEEAEAADQENLNEEDDTVKDNAPQLSSQVLDIDGEQTPSQFRLVIVQMLNLLLDRAYEDDNLKLLLAQRIPDFVRIAFVCLTSSVATLRVAALQILGRVIDIYGPMRDPAYPDVSILDQQQAQIITAIIPAFDKESNIDLASQAVVLASQLVTSGITPVARMGRIIKVLVNSLESFATDNGSNGSIKVGDISVVSKKAQSKIKVHILQAWARMSTGDLQDEQLKLLLKKYSSVLVPLWLYSLREYATIQYGSDYLADTQDLDVAAYKDSWVDFLQVLGMTAEQDPSQFDILGEELGDFLYVIIGQTMEYLIRSKTGHGDVLTALSKILKVSVAWEIAFRDIIFKELIDLLDRLVTMSSEKTQVVELSKSMFTSYFSQERAKEDLPADVDKLFELIRINTLAISQILPFLKGEEAVPVAAADQPLLKKSFDSIVEMISFLPEVMQVDMYTCILYMFTQIYEQSPGVVPLLLPTLKRTITNFNAVAPDNANLLNFYSTIKSHLAEDDLLTVFIIVSTINLRLADNEADQIANYLIEGLKDESVAPLATQTVKTLIKERSSGPIMRSFIPKLIQATTNQELQEPRLLIEILVMLAKSSEGDQLTAIYELTIPLLEWFTELNGSYRDYVRQKLLELIRYSPATFKEFIGKDPVQAARVQAIIKDEDAPEEDVPVDEESHIELKTFS